MGVKDMLDRLYEYKNGAEDENLIDDVIQMIIDLDLVRCGECKWWNEETHGCNRNPCVKAWWETDYCSYGERK